MYTLLLVLFLSANFLSAFPVQDLTTDRTLDVPVILKNEFSVNSKGPFLVVYYDMNTKAIADGAATANKEKATVFTVDVDGANLPDSFISSEGIPTESSNLPAYFLYKDGNYVVRNAKDVSVLAEHL